MKKNNSKKWIKTITITTAVLVFAAGAVFALKSAVPCGKDKNGLPIGLQLIGDCFKENNLIRAGYAYEQARGRFE